VLKFITSSLRPLGMIGIFIFAVGCIFASLFVRTLDNTTILGGFVDYTVSFENRFYDFRMRSQIDRSYKSKEITLVKIDDYSLQKLGMWPIPRGEYAKLLNKLKDFGAKIVAMDIMFPEKSPHFGAGLSPDSLFAQAIKNFQTDGRRVFLSYTLADENEEALEEAPVEMLNDAIITRTEQDANMTQRKIAKFTFPIDELISSEAGLGYISSVEDSDGVHRQYRLIANIDTIYYGSLAYNTFEAYLGDKKTITIFTDGNGEFINEGKKLEISPLGETKIRYKGGDSVFEDLSIYDVINAESNDEKIRSMIENRIIFIGSTAIGAHDLRPSPIDNKMPGVYAHINMTHMLLHNYFFKSSNDSVKISLLLLILGFLIFFFIQRFGNPFLDAATLILLITSTYYLDLHFFLAEGYELKLFYCYFCFISSYSWNTFLKFYEANKEKKQIRGTFSRYVAPTIVDEMLKDPDKLHVGGIKMDITCLFSDVRDFTKISENLSATELSHSLNIYMGAMTDIVFETKGTLDKYIGDAIVALWGAPLPIGNHAQYAVEGAIKMMNKLPEINQEFERLGRPRFKVGIGLNSGECSVGNMGSERIFSYTALGDNMNLGARLESLCKYYGAQILISDMTLERLDLSNIKTRPIDKVIVKGKTLPVGVHEVFYDHHFMMKNPSTLDTYLKAWKLFQQKKFLEAKTLFDQIIIIHEQDEVSRRLMLLCQKYLESPDLVGENFDVTIMTEK
jgi:adenylate cyclase